MDASDFDDEMTVEQLWEILPQQVGVAKVSTLIDLANATASKNEYGYALSIAETSVETANAEKDEQVLAKALVTRAHVYWHLDRYRECGDDYLKAASLFEHFDALPQACRGYYDAAKAFYFADLDEMALDFNAQAISLALAAEDREAYGRCLLQKARIMESLRHAPEEVIEVLSEARSEFRSLHMPQLVLDADEHRMSVYYESEQYIEALDIARRAVFVAETISESKGAYFNFILGKLMRLTNEPHEAVKYLNKSEEMNRRLEDLSAVASVQSEKARCAIDYEEYDLAIELAESARAHFEACGADEPLFSCDMVKAHALHNSGEFQTALEFNYGLLEQTEDREERFIIDLNLADIYYAMGDHRTAHAHLDGMEIDPQWVGQEPLWFTHQTIRALTYQAQGETDKAQQLALEATSAPGFSRATAKNKESLRELAS